MPDPRITFTVHAVSRYVERVRPGIDYPMAKLELLALTEFGRITVEPPEWYPPSFQPDYEQPAAYLILGDIAFPLQPDRQARRGLVAITCLNRGLMGDETRQKRNDGRRRRQTHRGLTGRMKHGRESRRARLALKERA